MISFQDGSGEVLSSLLLNAVDLLRVDLRGVFVLLPQVIRALEMSLLDAVPQYRCVTKHTVNFKRRLTVFGIFADSNTDSNTLGLQALRFIFWC